MKTLLGANTWAGSREGLVGRPIMASKAAAATDAIFLTANPHRRGLILSNLDSTNDIVVAVNQPATLTLGWRIVHGQNPLILMEYWLGKLAEAEWHLIAVAGTPTLGWTELED